MRSLPGCCLPGWCLPGALVLGVASTGCVIYLPDGSTRHERPRHHHGAPDDGDAGGGFGDGGFGDGGFGDGGFGGGGDDGGGDDGGGDGVDADFAAFAVEILPEGEGLDLDGDGAVDNNLPVALERLAEAIGGDPGWDPGEELQRLVDDGIWVPLMQARDLQDGLEIGLLAGTRKDDGDLAILAASYDDTGAVNSLLRGEWTRSGGFEVGPAPIRLPARLSEGTEVLFPVDDAVLIGAMSDDGAETMLVGVIPAAGLIDAVLVPYLGDQGLDMDGDGVADLSTEAVLDLAAAFLDDPDVVDIVGEDGAAGISVALWLGWEPTTL